MRGVARMTHALSADRADPIGLVAAELSSVLGLVRRVRQDATETERKELRESLLAHYTEVENLLHNFDAGPCEACGDVNEYGRWCERCVSPTRFGR